MKKSFFKFLTGSALLFSAFIAFAQEGAAAEPKISVDADSGIITVEHDNCKTEINANKNRITCETQGRSHYFTTITKDKIHTIIPGIIGSIVKKADAESIIDGRTTDGKTCLKLDFKGKKKLEFVDGEFWENLANDPGDKKREGITGDYDITTSEGGRIHKGTAGDYYIRTPDGDEVRKGVSGNYDIKTSEGDEVHVGVTSSYTLICRDGSKLRVGTCGDKTLTGPNGKGKIEYDIHGRKKAFDSNGQVIYDSRNYDDYNNQYNGSNGNIIGNIFVSGGARVVTTTNGSSWTTTINNEEIIYVRSKEDFLELLVSGRNVSDKTVCITNNISLARSDFSYGFMPLQCRTLTSRGDAFLELKNLPNILSKVKKIDNIRIFGTGGLCVSGVTIGGNFDLGKGALLDGGSIVITGACINVNSKSGFKG